MRRKSQHHGGVNTAAKSSDGGNGKIQDLTLCHAYFAGTVIVPETPAPDPDMLPETELPWVPIVIEPDV